MALSRIQILFLIGIASLWAIGSCTHAQSSPFAPPATGDSIISAQNRVHLDARVENLAPGDYRSVFTVPANRWFVLTDFDFVVEGIGDLRLSEYDGRNFVTKRENYFMARDDGYHSESGMVFRPGTDVVLVNRAFNVSVLDDIGYTMSGYLLAN